MTTITVEEFQSLGRLADDLCGIQWDESKQYLAENRIGAVLRSTGANSISDLVHGVRRDAPGFRDALIDAITTRETHFFRDLKPFDALSHKVIPEAIDDRSDSPLPQRLRIWSAACSSGQEPYSIAITLCELIDDIHDWDVQIYATDICDNAVTQASHGIYSEFEVNRGVPDNIRDRYFARTDEGWRVSDELRSLVRFERRNLLEPFGGLGQFDVIFCRNVAIYFDLPVRRSLFENLSRVLTSTGALFAGVSEDLTSFGTNWKRHNHCGASFYRPNVRLAETAAMLRRSHEL